MYSYTCVLVFQVQCSSAVLTDGGGDIDWDGCRGKTENSGLTPWTKVHQPSCFFVFFLSWWYPPPTPPHTHTPVLFFSVTMSIVNIFTYADSVSSLIWASSLSSAILFIMLLVQRILSLREFMDVSYAWSLRTRILAIVSHFLPLPILLPPIIIWPPNQYGFIRPRLSLWWYSFIQPISYIHVTQPCLSSWWYSWIKNVSAFLKFFQTLRFCLDLIVVVFCN